MNSFVFNLEQALVNYLTSSITTSYPILPGHTNNPSATFDLPIICVVCESYEDQCPGYGLYKADLRVDIVANARDATTYAAFDNADAQVQNALTNQAAVMSFTNIGSASSSIFIAGILQDQNNSIIGDVVEGVENGFANSQRYSVFAPRIYPSSSVVYPQYQG